MQSLINQINENIYSVLETITKKDLVKVIKYFDKYYNTGKPVMEDEVYDLLIEYLEEIDPKNDLLKTQNMSIFNEFNTN